MSEQPEKFKPSPDWEWDRDYTEATLVRKSDHGVFRARIEREMYPDEPYNDGGCPVIRIETGHGYGFGYRAADTGYGRGYEDGLPRPATEILEHFHHECGAGAADSIDIFERYLRIFHGGFVATYGPNQNYTDFHYVAYVTQALWEAWGNADRPLTQDVAEMTEWIAYLEGDVYGVSVERACAFDEDGDPIDWEEVGEGQVWGYYGEDNAMEEAEIDLAAEIRDTSQQMLPLDSPHTPEED